jgi:Helix-turn-helix domain
MEDETISAAAKCVVVVLLLKYRDHKTGQCNPGFTALAKCVGRKRRSVIDALNELKAAGWIGWDGTKGGSQTNTNNFKFFLTPKPVQWTAPVQSDAPVQSEASTGAVQRTQPVQSTAHDLSIEPSKNHTLRSGKGRFGTKTDGVRVHSDSSYADGWRRHWAAAGQAEPAYSQRDGYYLQPLPSLLPPKITECAA